MELDLGHWLLVAGQLARLGLLGWVWGLTSTFSRATLTLIDIVKGLFIR